jgi:hypothetical protein
MRFWEVNNWVIDVKWSGLDLSTVWIRVRSRFEGALGLRGGLRAYKV